MSSMSERVGAALFAFSVVHVFLARRIHRRSLRKPVGSLARAALGFLGETEVVFAIWAAVLLAILIGVDGFALTVQYLAGRDFSEPLFVFAAMAVASSRPVLRAARALIELATRLTASAEAEAIAFYLNCLIIGPLLGSLITEPAAMTVTALLVRERFLKVRVSSRFLYLTLAVLFVNVSIGGSLTDYAAPPVLMVAKPWGLTAATLLRTLGWKAAVAVALNALLAAAILRADIKNYATPKSDKRSLKLAEVDAPTWSIFLMLALLGIVIVFAHEPLFFLLALATALVVARAAPKAIGSISLAPGALVALFLAGLVVLGGVQSWWLGALLRPLNPSALFFGSAGLTAVLDNAALTYLGAQIEGLGEAAKYALLAGALAGGGLTVIANAPNPAGAALWRSEFGPDGLSPWLLFTHAALPTIIALAAFWLLPSL